jgi:hypothetical protein
MKIISNKIHENSGGVYHSLLTRSRLKKDLSENDEIISKKWISADEEDDNKFAARDGQLNRRRIHSRRKKPHGASSSMNTSILLPKAPGAFGSHHVMINTERVLRNIHPLIREQALDEVAQQHAKYMALKESVEHSTVAETASKIMIRTGLCRMIGENVYCTASAPAVTANMPTRTAKPVKRRRRKSKPTQEAYKKQFATSIADRKNILNDQFETFGVGTAQSLSGKVYICQIFRG